MTQTHERTTQERTTETQPTQHAHKAISYKQAAIKEKQNFIYNLIFLRELKGYKQQDVIRHLAPLGVKFKTYQAWEEERAFPPVFICRHLCQIFRTDMETMFTERYKYPEE